MRGPTVTHTNRGANRGRLALVVVAVVAALFGATLTPMAAYADDIGSISGHVSSEATADVVGATVSLYINNGYTFVDTTTSDGSGEWSFTGLPENSGYKIFFEKPGYASQWYGGSSPYWAQNIAVFSDDVTGIEGYLSVGATISGTVTDEASGDPFAGVTVYAFDDWGYCDFRNDAITTGYCEETTTDALGNYTFDTLSGGVFKLLFHQDGYVDIYNGGGRDKWDAPTISVDWEGSSTGNDMALTEEATISGTLTALGSGTPIEEANIAAFTTSGDFVDSVSTDSSGNYIVDGLLPGTYKLQFSANGYLTTFWDGKSRLGSATHTELTIGQDLENISAELDPGASVSGTIMANAVPVVDAQVSAFDSHGQFLQTTVTDEFGHYTVSGLGGGSFTVGANKWDAEPCLLNTFLGGGYDAEHGTYFSLTAHGSVSGKNIAMTRCATISGTVSGAGAPNVPLGNAYVTAWDTSANYVNSAFSDVDGNYVLDGLVPGTYKLLFDRYDTWAGKWYGGGTLQSSALGITVAAAGTATANVVLPIGGTISGNVKRAPSTNLENAFVTAYGSVPDYVYSDLTDVDGNYTLTGLPADTYKLEFSRGYSGEVVATSWWNNVSSKASATGIPVALGGAVVGKNAILTSGATITGRVTADLGGAPLEFASVSAVSSTGDELAWEQTDSDGNYALEGLPAGSVRLEFSTYDGQYLTEWWDNKSTLAAATVITVANGVTYPNKNAALAGSASISGHVTDPNLEDIDSIAVGAFLGASPEPVSWAMTDGNGNYTLPGLTAGSYVLGFSDYGTGAAFAPNEGINFRTEFYNNQATRAAANAVSVATGAYVTDKDAVMDLVGVLGSPTPTITGNAVVGQTLTAVAGSWSPSPVTLTYQWKRDGVDIPGKTASTYPVVVADFGHTLSVSVTGAKSGYSAVTVTSAPTDTVLDALTAPVPTISGTGAVGQTLTAVAGAWGPSPVDLSYQWYRNGVAIASETASTYLLVGADAGTNVTVTVTGTKDDYATQSKTSVAKAIGNVLTAPTPSITGSTVSGQTLTAVPGVWAPAPVTLAYQWQRDGGNVAGKTAATYLLSDLDVGHTLSVTVTGAKVGYTTASQTSAQTATVTGLLTAPVPTITGTGAIGQTLTAVPGVWGPAPVTLSYQWFRNGELVDGETASTYVLGGADAGLNVTVAVTGTKANFATQTKTSAGKAVGSVLTTAAPSISGIPTVGKPQTAVPGTWGPAPVTLAYQWKRDGIAIVGAISSVYTATAADSGKALSVSVTGSKAGYTSVVETSSAVVIGNAFTAAPIPVIVGTPTAGTDLIASIGVWGPAPVTLAFQWLKDGSAIAGETGSTYTPTTADADSSITFRVTATKAGFTPVTVTSLAKVIGLPLSDIGIPSINGQSTVGQVLTASPGTWSPAPVSFGYQWNRAGVAIAGATGSTYTPVTADGGKQLTVTVTGSKASYLAVAVTSPTMLISFALTGPTPTITGVPTVGQRVTAVPGTWAPAPVTLSYKWLRDGVDIVGATASSYLLTGADVGTNLTVEVRGARAGYTSISHESANLLIGLALAAAPIPTITGIPTVNETLTAVPGAWGPDPVDLTYQWKRAGVAIPAATDVDYTLVPADLAKAITVTVTGSKDGYTSASATSAAKTIGNFFTLAPTPTVTGTPEVGFTLTAVPGVWALAPVTLAYKWLRNGVAIAGATMSTYKLVTLDAGEDITVTVTGSKTGYTPLSQTSADTEIKSLLVAPLPEIFGIPTVGETLTADVGLWAPLPVDFTLQWKRAGVAIAGETGEDYVLVPADLGKAITVTVTGTKDGFSAASRTSPAKTIGSALTATPTPTISGTLAVGSILTAAPGVWTPAPVTLSYQWLRNGSPIVGATAATYKLVTADAGQYVHVRVTGSKIGYTPTAVYSSGVDIQSLLTTAIPTITGVTTVGETVSVVPGAWGPDPVDLTVQWKRAGVAIPLATDPDYELALVDIGKVITVTVTGTKADYTSASTTSLGKTISNVLTATPTPTITGTPAVGSILTAVPGVWTPAPVTLAYKWLRNGVAIAGATLSTYKLVTLDAGQSVTVTVTGSKAGYASVPQTSAGTDIQSLLTTAVPTITGVTTVNETLTAVPGSWGPDPVDLTFQWKRAGVAIGGATAVDYQLVLADAGKAITVTVTGAKDEYTSASITSPAKTISNVLTATPVPTITGTPAVGSILTAVPGVWTPAPVTLSYKWSRNGVAIAGAVAATYKLVTADAGQSVTVTVTGSKVGYASVLQTSAGVDIQSLLTTVVPTITGVPTVGEMLTAVPGTWGPDPVDLTFQWKRAGVAIAGATGEEYTLLPADLAKAITVTVTGAKVGYTSASTTSAAKTIGNFFDLTPIPTITGTPSVGSTLTAVPGTWAPAPVTFSYQWNRDGVPIAGAIAATYKLVTADASQVITVNVKGSKTGYTPYIQLSADTIVESLLTTVVPTITGVPTVGEMLTAVPGTWGPDPVDLTFQWKRAGVAIVGEAAGDYTLVTADIGKVITVTVTGTKPGFTSASTTSAGKTINNKLTLTPTPTVTGTPAVGSTLTAVPGVWTLAPVTLAYKWLRNGVAIAGATLPTYKLVTADAGQTITVTVTGSKAGYASVPQTSADVEVQSLLTTVVPTIAGIPTVGEILTVVPGEWGPAPVDLTYQWKRAGVAIPAATDSDYTLVAADLAKAITVTVTGAKDDYTSASATSAAKTIGSALTATPVPAVTGTPSVGSTLIAVPGVWTPAPVTLSYKWSRNGVAIAGAVAATYKLVTADAGQTVTVTVTGAKAGYTSVARTSTGTAVEALLTVTPVPTITGVAAVGETVSAVAGVWGPGSVSIDYQWRRAGVAIPGATGSSYTLVAADAGVAITVVAIGFQAGYTTVGKTSAAILPYASAPTPTITGATTIGSVQTAVSGTWGVAPVTLKYQWYRNGVAIAGATLATYTLAVVDLNTAITVTVTGSKAGYATIARTSIDVNPLFGLIATPRPSIDGVPSEGNTVTANYGEWGPTTVDLEFQWFADGVPIDGANTSWYVVEVPNGTILTVQVTGSKTNYLTVTKLSPGVLIQPTF